ncbi:MAG: MFS transporter [Candidatus Aphodosoma sp.]
MAKLEKKVILPLAMMCALFFIISFVTGLQNPMGVIVRNQFGVSNFLSQLGNAANFIAYLCMGVPTGMLIRRIGYKKTALAAIAVGLTGVIISYLSGIAGSFAVYVTGAFISGFSMCMLNTVVNPMVNTLAGGGKRGNQFLQLGGTLNSLGATIVPILVGTFIGNASRASIADATPALIIAVCIFAAAFIVLHFMPIPEPHIEKHDNRQTADKHSALSFRHFVLGMTAIFFYVGVEVGIPNIANLFMTSETVNGGLAMDGGVAGTVVGTYWFLMLAGRFIGVAAGSKVSAKAMLTTVSVIALLLVLTAIILPGNTVTMPTLDSNLTVIMTQLPVNLVLLTLCGLCTSVMWGGIFNLAIEGLGRYTAAASGLFMTMVCGGGIMPMIQGLIADHFGYLNSYFIIIFGLAFILWYALWGSRNVNTDIETA